jgi:hypothetical protein
MNEQNLETRVKRLEMLHFWALTAIAVVVVGYVIYKEK